MIVPMENSPTQMAKDAVQCRYNKAIELEQRLRNSIQAKTPSDPNIWGQMRENYESIILEDHDFSEAHEIEHALWHLHYKRIEEFRARMRSTAMATNSNNPSQEGKSVVRRDQIHKIRSVFKSFLSDATGFYHELILKIKARYRFPVDYFSHQGEDYLGLIEDKTKSVDLRKAQVSCHRCLIYLGDLACYKELYGEGESSGRDFSVAASYYVQAASLWPSNGNPHRQWLPELRHFAPSVPIVIVGTKLGNRDMEKGYHHHSNRSSRSAHQEMALISRIKHPYIVGYKEAWVEKENRNAGATVFLSLPAPTPEFRRANQPNCRSDRAAILCCLPYSVDDTAEVH